MKSVNSALFSVIPGFGMIMILVLIPTTIAAWMSLHLTHIIGGVQKTVWTHSAYLTVLHDPDFWNSLWLTLVYSILCVILQILLGTVAAGAVHQLSRNAVWSSLLIFLP